MAEASAGRVIGRYALFDVLATGGMDTVYFARLLGPVGAGVALFFLWPPTEASETETKSAGPLLQVGSTGFQLGWEGLLT